MGAEIEPWTTYRMQGTLNFLQEVSRHTLELFPQLERARLLRSWAGLCDLSPDYSPILGKTEVEGFHVSAGWGTYGFKAAPIVGKTLAELVATDQHARPDRAVRAGALLRGQARVGARRRGGEPLMSLDGTRRGDEEQPGDRAGGGASADRVDRRGRPGCCPTSSSPTAATRRRSRWARSTASRTRPTASSSASPASRRPRRARARPPRPCRSPRASATSARTRCCACASRRSGRCSASRAAPPAAGWPRSCRWRTSTSTSPATSTRSAPPTTCSRRCSTPRSCTATRTRSTPCGSAGSARST